MNDELKRDCTHIATVVLIAGEDLYKGEKFRLAYGTNNIALKGDYSNNALGIVDPFLSDEYPYIDKGKEFTGWLFPNTITGMKHHWQHPAFDNITNVTKNPHELWLRKFCDKWNFDFDQLVEAGIDNNKWVTARGYDLHSSSEIDPVDLENFWIHLEGYVGQKFDEKHRLGMTWSCSC